MRVNAKILVLFAVAILGAAVQAPDDQPLPIGAHNCYPSNSARTDRLVEALRLGIDNIEIDLGWDEEHARLIVGHDIKARPGVTYPELEAYLVPALEAHWRTPRADGAPSVLTVDFKTERPEALAQFTRFLEAHADWFSTAPKAKESPLTRRRLTVCLTGSDTIKDLYDSQIPAGGTYRAFRDRVFGAAEPYRTAVTEYASARATAYHRFLTVHWSHVERGGPPLAGTWTSSEMARLDALVTLFHGEGFRARFYCLDGHTGPVVSPYRFADDASAQIRWRAAARAGVDWVASDEYEAIVQTLEKSR